MLGATKASGSSNKWASRASYDPFHETSITTLTTSNGGETAEFSTNEHDDGKENRIPSIGRNWGHPNVTMRRGSGPLTVTDALVPSSLRMESQTSSSVLGKRPHRTTPALHEADYHIDYDERESKKSQLNTLPHFEARALNPHGSALSFDREEAEEETTTGIDCTTIFVDDFTHVGHLRFGTVALGESKSQRLILENANEQGNARVKYEGYRLLHDDRTTASSDLTHIKPRFQCDLHLCVVDALKSVTLRVTFNPLPLDVGRQVIAMLKFTVNGQFSLQCRAIGTVIPSKPKLSGIKRIRPPQTSVVVASSGTNKQPNQQISLSSALTVRDLEPENESFVTTRAIVGEKRHLSTMIEFSPPRNLSKRRKSEALSSSKPLFSPRKSLGACGSQEKKLVTESSWWKQRQEVYDGNWRAKQTEGFIKWMNYVLLEGSAFCWSGEDDPVELNEPRAGIKRRIDFSSLRVLAQKRMESRWTHAALELYHSSRLEDVLYNLQDEIGNKRLLFRADRPVYADVGLQEELMSLLYHYHPVWLCLGLYAVLGSQIMAQEKCSLRNMFLHGQASNRTSKKTGKTKIPSVLRRVILKHLVKDSHVAQNYSLVQKLTMPLDGSTVDRGDGGNAFQSTKKHITGREYFDSLTQSFMLKFLMLVLFLDRAIEHRVDKFVAFPCLFRRASARKPTMAGKALNEEGLLDNGKKENDRREVKQSQALVTEFCRLFLASEGRIDKHLKQLGYTLHHEQTALDEMEWEIQNLETDLRDGVRLAKLMETLAASSSSCSNSGRENTRQCRNLLSFLRVPALSRLQKVHNVEICLHFLQDKCGASILESLKSPSVEFHRRERLGGRVRVSLSGFAGLRAKVDAKMVSQLAKEIVNGHREKTLALVWKVISHFQLQALVDARTMKHEIDNVVKRMSFRAKAFYDAHHQEANDCVGSRTEEHECYGLLLEWCRAVCANYDVAVTDFSRSFADGKVLCYLLHYYHPLLVSKAEILPTTRDEDEGDQEGCQVNERDRLLLLANEARHFHLVNACVKQLGQIPVLMPSQYNTKNPPDEKMVVTFVCYLQSRLMDSCSELHAATRLKRWWQSPWIRLRLYRKKTRSARVIQRFWYTSSQHRLAIRQCRKLLRAAHVVKGTVVMWVFFRRFQRLRKAVRVIQRAVRCRQTLRLNEISLGAIQVIQFHWRNQVKWRQLKRHELLQTEDEKNTRRARSCSIIERNWLRYLSRASARLVRQQMLVDREKAVVCIQRAWRERGVRIEEERHRILALEKLELLMKEKKLETRRNALERRIQTRAVYSIQKTFRAFVFRKRMAAATTIARVFRGRREKCRFVKEKQAVKVLERSVCSWRRRRQVEALSQCYKMWRIYQEMKREEADRREKQLERMKEIRACRWIQRFYRRYRSLKREFAAIKIQSMVRCWRVQRSYHLVHWSVCLLQRNVRIWRRGNHLRALLTFQNMLVCYQRRQQEEKTRACRCIQRFYRRYRSFKREFAAIKIQSMVRCWRVQRSYHLVRWSVCLLQRNVRIWRRWNHLRALWTFQDMLVCYQRRQQEEKARQERQRRFERLEHLRARVKARAASCIQSVYRCYALQKREGMAIRLQTFFRGLQARQRYVTTRKRVVMLQRTVRTWSKLTRFRRALKRHCAARTIQKRVRGWLSRSNRLNFYALQAHVTRLRLFVSCWKIEHWYMKTKLAYRKKRLLRMRSHWTRLCGGIWQKRRTDIAKIARCWRGFWLKSCVKARIERRKREKWAAERLQLWWMTLCCHWAEREQEKERKKMETIALAHAQARAARLVASWVYERSIVPARERQVMVGAVKHLQAWWRGTLVRLYCRNEEISRHRRKISRMKLVEKARGQASVSLQHLRVKTSRENGEIELPQTLSARLEVALHMLLHGKRLQDMLFASHTIELCTRYSRECCHKCVQLQISSTIFAAIRGLNRSRPHVELLHQLLLVLKNLTVYRRSADRKKQRRRETRDEVDGRLDVDLRALDTLVDLLHIHRDMHHVFVLSAEVISYYLVSLKPLIGQNGSVDESWKEAEKRLTGLQELSFRKLALYNATASFRRVNEIPETNATNLMRKMNPKTAVTMMEQLVGLLKR